MIKPFNEADRILLSGYVDLLSLIDNRDKTVENDVEREAALVLRSHIADALEGEGEYHYRRRSAMWMILAEAFQIR